MARNDGRSTPDDELEAPARPTVRAYTSVRANASRGGDPDVLDSTRRAPEPGDDEDDDFPSRLMDLDEEEQSPFLRAQKRVSVRRGPVTRKAANRIRLAAIALLCLGIAGIVAFQLYGYGTRSWRFRIESSDDIAITGLHNVTHAQAMDVFGGDLGRNVFFVPLAERKRQLERIPWIESASVSRLLPNRLAITIHERTPVAFAQVGSRLQLIDSGGVLMELPSGGKRFSFPVLVGMNESEPLSTRAARMRIYTRLMKELDAEGARYSQEISEVDLSDPEDARVTSADDAGSVLVHLGDTDFLPRYRIFKTHLAEWRRQFQQLRSVDLRYERQVIVNAEPAAASQSAAAATPNATSPQASVKPPLHAAVKKSAPRR